jgi:membrane-associated phospholipid phosphatase
VLLASADLALLRLARTRGHAPAAERAVAAFSKTGEHAALWLAIGTAGFVVDGRRRRRWARALAGVGGGYVLNTAIKLVVRRPRPQLSDLPPLTHTVTQLSCPSAHATTSSVAAWAYAPLVGAGIVPVAVAMCASRVYLGVHYPSDIVAGAVLGTAIGGLAR